MLQAGCLLTAEICGFQSDVLQKQGLDSLISKTLPKGRESYGGGLIIGYWRSTDQEPATALEWATCLLYWKRHDRVVKWHGPLDGPNAPNIQSCRRSKPFLKAQGKEAPSYDHGVSIGGIPNLERKLQALDPGSYLNPRKRALEEVRGIGGIFSIDSSPSAKQEYHGKSLRQVQQKQQLAGGDEDPEWPAAISDHTSPEQGQSILSHDDFRSLVVQSNQGESFTLKTPIDSALEENAYRKAELAQRMPENDSQTLGRGRLQGPNRRQTIGEIVEVEGGHIVRSTGRKDRHSKVYTAKGPRDRRVRLSALTAIQFYDVQDRLGYDRPSKAVDWLIKKAKASIDELARLPQRGSGSTNHAHANSSAIFGLEARSSANFLSPDYHKITNDRGKDNPNPQQMVPGKEQLEVMESSKVENEATISGHVRADPRAIARERARERAKERTQERDAAAAKARENLTYPPREQFYTTNVNNSTPSPIQTLQQPFTANQTSNLRAPVQTETHTSYPNYVLPDPISRNLQALHSSSLQPTQNYSTSQFDAMQPSSSALGDDNSGNNNIVHESNLFINSTMPRNHQNLFSRSTASAFQAAPVFGRDIVMSEHHEFNRPQRILSATPWNFLTDFGTFGYNQDSNNSATGSAPNMRGHNSFTFRGTLQSSSTPFRLGSVPLMHDDARPNQYLQTAAAFAPGGFSGFRIPARIQGIDEHDDVKPSAASSSQL
eukprot:Gb_18221 [translate_table: standard]